MIKFLSHTKTAAVLSCTLLAMYCASYTPIEKVYEDNRIVKIVLNDKKGVTGWYIVAYDSLNRITGIHKFTPKKNSPQVRIQLQYRGKMLSSYTIATTPPDSDRIITQSTHIFNYTSANLLRRVDVSFTKPASIRQAGTTFIRIQYSYTDKVLTGLFITGDAFSFKISCTLNYEDDAINVITIDEKRYNTASKKFEQGLKGQLEINSYPTKFVDEAAKTVIKDKKQLADIYSRTFIEYALDKPLFLKGNEHIIDYFLKLDGLQ